MSLQGGLRLGSNSPTPHSSLTFSESIIGGGGGGGGGGYSECELFFNALQLFEIDLGKKALLRYAYKFFSGIVQCSYILTMFTYELYKNGIELDIGRQCLTLASLLIFCHDYCRWHFIIQNSCLSDCFRFSENLAVIFSSDLCFCLF